jgi:hypothetical protein
MTRKLSGGNELRNVFLETSPWFDLFQEDILQGG